MRLNCCKKFGFTIIETMIVLSITGLMLVGFMVSATAQINQQREKDAVQDFASWLQEQISEVLYPREGAAAPGNQVIWGRLIAVRPIATGSTQMRITAYPLTEDSDWNFPVGYSSLYYFSPNTASINVQLDRAVTYEPKWQGELGVSSGGPLMRRSQGFNIFMIRKDDASEIQYVNVRPNNTVVGSTAQVASVSGNGGPGGSFGGFCIGLNDNWTTIAMSFGSDLDNGWTGGNLNGVAGTDMIRILNRDSEGNLCRN